MATIVGSVMTSHVPAMGGASAGVAEVEPYWKALFAACPPVHEWLARVQPDVAVVFYNDHGLNFSHDKMPTFAVGAAAEYRSAGEGPDPHVARLFSGDPELSWHLIEYLVNADFDLTSCQEMLVDHAFTVPMRLLWPRAESLAVRTVPIAINTVQHPMPSAARCFALGRAVARAIEAYPEDVRVLVLGTGGLSRQVEGSRAGSLNREFDLMCRDSLVKEPEFLNHYTSRELVELGGTQAAELLVWVAARAAMLCRVREVHRNYHIPVPDTAAGLLVLETAAVAPSNEKVQEVATS